MLMTVLTSFVHCRSYTSVEDMAEIISQLGQGSLLAKVDIEAAYRLIPVHPQDHPLQVVRFNATIRP